MAANDIKFMICDDSILARKNLIDMLNTFGYANILEVSNGQDAVDTYKAERPAIVLLDIVMPVKDGITATKEIMKMDPDACIIIVSSVGTQTHLREAIKSGAKDFVQKPIESELLKQIIDNCLSA